MKKPQISVRMAGESKKLLNREVVRLTINPILLFLSNEYVDWSGREGGDKIRAYDLVFRAHRRFPKLPLSWAVEGYIALLAAEKQTSLHPPLLAEDGVELGKNVINFMNLSPAEKIRVGLRWKAELQILRRAK
ncbi:MAG: hypothetical protein JRJ87_19640 [Deltaproteobacteria bacterium]|nr:hypothetical protein [Deltaproteobacteria bacterium]